MKSGGRRKYTIFNDFVLGVYGSVYAAKNRKHAEEMYNCECGCNQLSSDENCDCSTYHKSNRPEVRPHTFYYDDRMKYAGWMRMENDNPKLKHTHPPILTFTIKNIFTGQRFTMVSSNLTDILKEVERLNFKYGKELWIYEEEIDYNRWLVSSYHDHEIFVAKNIK